MADDSQKGKRSGTLTAATDVGAISISANVKINGPRAGLRRIHTQNPDRTWTSVLIDHRGALVGYAYAPTKKGCRDLLDAQEAPGPE